MANKNDLIRLYDNDGIPRCVVSKSDGIFMPDGNTTLTTKMNEVTSSLEQNTKNIDKKNITNYGVIPNSENVQNIVINEAIKNGGKFYFPKGRYIIDDSIILYNNTILELDSEAIIEFKSGVLADSTINSNVHEAKHIFKNHLTNGTKNIEIFGGTIIGNALTQKRDAHKGFRFDSVDNLKIHDIELVEISGWCFQLKDLTNFHIHNIRFKQAPESLGGFNGDGVSFTGKNGVIENLYGYVSDDMISTHSGESNHALNSNTENVIIRNINCEPLIWQDEDGVTHTEYCHRAFSMYSFNNKINKNVILDGVYGISKKPLRIICDGNDTTPHLIDCEIKNINIEISPWETSTNYEKSALYFRNLRTDKIVLENVNLKYDGVNQLYGVFVHNSRIKNLHILNSSFENLNSDDPCILDNGYIDNLIMDNVKITSPKNTGLAYYKKYVNTSPTKVKFNNIYGTINDLVGRDSNAVVQLINNYSTPSKEKGVGEINCLNVDSTTVVYNKFKIINVRQNNCNIVLKSTTEESGYSFYLNVNNVTGTQIFNDSSTRIFTNTTINKGLYLITRFLTDWLIIKLSDENMMT